MAEPILKWAGGKRAMLDELLPRLPPNSEFNRYFEPFFGGGAVFFSLQPDNGYINDINPRLMNFYKEVKHNPEQIIAQNKKFDKEYKKRDEEARSTFYYQKRDEFNALRKDPEECDDPLMEASLFLFLNRTCFNGLYRTNTDGEFNVPQGSKWTEIAVLEPRIREAHRILQNTTITCRDFTYIKEHVAENDLVFFDPPYPSVRKSGSFEKYHPGGFGFEQQKELKELAVELHERGAYVLITNGRDGKEELEKENYVKDLYDEEQLPAAFRRVNAAGKRMINSDSTRRTDIGDTDIIVTNFSRFDIQQTFEDYR